MTEDEARKDLDETRRLLYMALLRQKTEKYELAGTLVNALLHHQGIDASREEITRHILNVIEESDPDSENWLIDQIDRIGAELGS